MGSVATRKSQLEATTILQSGETRGGRTEVGKGRGGQRREEEMEGGRVKGRGKRISLVKGGTSPEVGNPSGIPPGCLQGDCRMGQGPLVSTSR